MHGRNKKEHSTDRKRSPVTSIASLDICALGCQIGSLVDAVCQVKKRIEEDLFLLALVVKALLAKTIAL